jgi:glycerol-3-phosphate dehydrogenase (NAD(P)+)
MILSAVPTQYMRSVWQRLGKYLPAGLPIVSVAKGIENGTLLRPTQVINDVLAAERMAGAREAYDAETRHGDAEIGSVPASCPPVCSPLVALSGPNIAAELAKCLPATAVAASADEACARRVQSVFSTQWFRVYTNADVVGVELAGAMKNIVAIAAGILDGLAAGNNAKAALVTRGLVEITRLGVAMGAHPDTFTGLAGLGDLITTCVSPEGRNRTVGERIGKGQKVADILAKMDSVAEGVPTTQSVMQLARRHNVEMPITEAVYAVLFENKDVLHALSDLMSRDPKPERIK